LISQIKLQQCLSVEYEQNQSLIKIEVPKVFAPVSYQGKFYKRSGSNTILLNGSALTNFLLTKYGKTWDDIAVEDFPKDQINLNTIEKFKRLAEDRIPNINQEKDPTILLQKLNLYDGKYLKRAAILLFAKNPQRYFPQSHSKIGRFLSETEIQTSDVIEDNLIDQVDRILDILRSKYLKAYIHFEGVHRRETLEYPYRALREAIINALIHRDYTISANLQIKVYNDKLVIYNGATLPSEISMDNLLKPHPSVPHNPIIASVFYKAGLIENWGRGTIDIMDECNKQGLPQPLFEYEFTTLKVTFYKAKARDGGVNGGVNEVYLFITQNPNIKAKQISQSLGIPLRTLQRYLNRLKSDGKIEFRGAPKTGGYFVVGTKH